MPARPGRIAQWWLDRPLRSKGLAVLTAPILVLVVTVGATFITERHQETLRDQTFAVNNIATESSQVLALLLNAETGVRGYALSHQPSFLEPYQQAVSQAPAAVAAWTSDAPGAIGQIDTSAVANLAEEQLASLARIKNGVASG